MLNKCNIYPDIKILQYKIPLKEKASAITPYGNDINSYSIIGNLESISSPPSIIAFEKKGAGRHVAW